MITSMQRYAYAKARALGVNVAIAEFPTYVHVEPASHIKEGSVTFIAEPLVALEYAALYATLEGCRVGARCLARRYEMPQSIWMLSRKNTDWGGMYIHCAESLDVGLYDTCAKYIETVDGGPK